MPDTTSPAAASVTGATATLPPSSLLGFLTGHFGGEPATVDARDLQVDVPAAMVADVLRAALRGRDVQVAFEENAILVTMAGAPPARVVVPAEGLRVRVTRDGMVIGG